MMLGAAAALALLLTACGSSSSDAGRSSDAPAPAATASATMTSSPASPSDTMTPVESPTSAPSGAAASASVTVSPGSTISPGLDPTSPVDVTVPTSGTGALPVVHRITTTDPVVFITIDDGYTKDPAVVSLLRTRHIPVTPFLAQTAINTGHAYFNLVQDASGQTVQDHSVNHPFLTKLSYDQQKHEICGAADQYATWFGTRPWLFRPPYGAYNQTTLRAAQACGMTTIVLWDASLPHSVIRFASGSKFHDGDILLIHWRPNLARDLGIAVDTIERQGLRVAALQDYLPRPS
jgi:peptidoglycan/xylan/chitin deacetylase (PgdA/CDA1 family)